MITKKAFNNFKNDVRGLGLIGPPFFLKDPRRQQPKPPPLQKQHLHASSQQGAVALVDSFRNTDTLHCHDIMNV
jgi:hypothetical protein